MPLVYKVQKFKTDSGEIGFVINDSINLSNINFDEESKLCFDMEFDANNLTEQEASEICQKFISEAIESFIKDSNVTN